jgi:hypothetical protein
MNAYRRHTPPGAEAELARLDARIWLLYTAGAAGGLIAAVAVPRIRRRVPAGQMTLLFLGLNVVAVAGVALAPGFGFALVALAGYLFCYSMVTVNGIAYRQEVARDGLQSRVVAAGRMLGWGGYPLGALAGGALAEVLPAQRGRLRDGCRGRGRGGRAGPGRSAGGSRPAGVVVFLRWRAAAGRLAARSARLAALRRGDLPGAGRPARRRHRSAVPARGGAGRQWGTAGRADEGGPGTPLDRGHRHEFVDAASTHGTRLELIDMLNGHHGFDTLDHTDESRRAVEQALDTVLRHLNQP